MTIKTEDAPVYGPIPASAANLAAYEEDSIIRQALNILEIRLHNPNNDIKICDPNDTKDFLVLKLAEKEAEVFSVMFLDNRHRLIEYVEMFQGTIDGASVYPREVVKAALQHNAAAVIVAHNHPSGVPEPSTADERITTRLKDALDLVQIRLLDHIIVGRTETVSLAERGML